MVLLQVDNPLFHVAKHADTIKARKDYKIVVGFDGSEAAAAGRGSAGVGGGGVNPPHHTASHHSGRSPAPAPAPVPSKPSVMAKLVVSCAKSAGGATNAQWVFYLKGVTPDGK